MGKTLDNFVTVKPNVDLRRYVDSFYFHSYDYADQTLKFTYYPHTKHAVTAYLGSTIQTNDRKTFVNPAPGKFTPIYSRVNQVPHQVEIRGAFKKVGIVFKPYGINYFVKTPIKNHIKQTISIFEAWNSEFQEVVKKIWESDELETRVALLNDFLIQHQTNQIDVRFQSIVEAIEKAERIATPKEIALQFHMSTKTLVRLFRKELDCTPSQFLKVARFRKSLEIYLEKENINLTQAALAQFYDQSNFIHTVKQITASTPKKLTREMSDLSNSIFWKID